MLACEASEGHLKTLQEPFAIWIKSLWLWSVGMEGSLVSNKRPDSILKWEIDITVTIYPRQSELRKIAVFQKRSTHWGKQLQENCFSSRLPHLVLIGEEVPSLTAAWYAMAAWYPREACPFLKRNREGVDVERQDEEQRLGGNTKSRGRGSYGQDVKNRLIKKKKMKRKTYSKKFFSESGHSSCIPETAKVIFHAGSTIW